MKKIIILTTIFIALVNLCNAQDNDKVNSRDELHIGPKIGLNLANVYDSKGQDFKADATLGLALGVFVAIPITTFIGVQPEIMFSQKGFEGHDKFLGYNYDFKRTTNYLDIPLFLAIKPTEYFTFLIGPQFSYLMSKTDVFTSGTTTNAQKDDFKNENIRKNTLGLSIGFDINMNHLVFGLRGSWDFQENNGDGTSTTPRYKNQLAQATIGYKF